MNFDNIIERYSVSFEIVPRGKGSYVDGEYVASSEEPIACTGAIVAIPRKKVYRSGGYLTTKDLNLIMNKPLEFTNPQIRYNGSLYNVEDDTDFSVFAGVYTYVLKWVSAFGGNDG